MNNQHAYMKRINPKGRPGLFLCEECDQAGSLQELTQKPCRRPLTQSERSVWIPIELTGRDGEECHIGDVFTIDVQQMAPLIGLPDAFIVSLHHWLSFDYTWKATDQEPEEVHRFRTWILLEAERRGWPEGWYEDPSVLDPAENGGTT